MHHCRNGSCLCTGLPLESVASRLREVVVILFKPLFRVHFSSTVSSSGLPSIEEPLGNWSDSSSKPLMWLRAWSMRYATKAWDTWIWSAWRRGISSLSSTVTCVLRENTEAHASWLHCQEGHTVETGYGKEDSDSLWEKNKSTPPKNGLGLDESPRKVIGSLSWEQTSAGQGLRHLIELWCYLRYE